MLNSQRGWSPPSEFHLRRENQANLSPAGQKEAAVTRDIYAGAMAWPAYFRKKQVDKFGLILTDSPKEAFPYDNLIRFTRGHVGDALNLSSARLQALEDI
jgi:hypothetical protein